MSRTARILVAGCRGMVGSALVRQLRSQGYQNLTLISRQEVDLLDQARTFAMLADCRPDYVFVAAARVGGIGANNRYRAAFLYENVTIAANVIHGAHLAGVDRLQFLGSSCIYPRDCPQPMREESLMTGPLETTNSPYAMAKLTGMALAEAYREEHGRGYFGVLPTNLYGPNDNYDLATSHVLPALLCKAHEAKRARARQLEVWGSGTPRREFLHVDDLAAACVFLMQRDYAGAPLNIGCGEDLTIRELAETICDIVGFAGELHFDTSKPDGTPRKLLDVSRLSAMGWRPTISLRDGIERTYSAPPFTAGERATRHG